MASARGEPVPEAAPLVGLVVGFAVAAYGFLFAPPGTHLLTLLLAVLPVYVLTAYAVVRTDEDVTRVLPPDAVLAGGFLAAAPVAGYGIVVAGQPAFGLFVALVVGVPPALYHARFGERVNPLSADATVAVAVLVAVLVGMVGAFDDPVVAMLAAALVVFAAVDYRDARGASLSERAEFSLVAATLGGAGLAVVYFAAVGEAVAGLLAGGALLVVGAYFAMD